MLRKLWLTSSLILILTISSGCTGVDVNAIGAGPLPVYEEVPALELSEKEKTTLDKWRSEDGALYTKIQSQSNKWRAIVRSHNEYAKKANKKKLEMMGFKEKDVQNAFQN